VAGEIDARISLLVDRHGHRLGPPEVAKYSSDDMAIAHAKQMLTGYIIEVCEADLIVQRVESEI